MNAKMILFPEGDRWKWRLETNKSSHEGGSYDTEDIARMAGRSNAGVLDLKITSEEVLDADA